jgi:hypothetical protein
VCADVGLRRWEVELVRALAHQMPVRPLQGESWVGERFQRDEVGVRLTDDERYGRRHKYDDPSAGPSHASPIEVDGVLEDFHRLLEAVL